MDNRRLAIGGLAALGAGSAAMGVANYLRDGITVIVGEQLLVGLLVAVTLLWARHDRSALRFDDPELPRLVRAYGPLGIAVLGGITLISGMVLLALVVG